MILKENISFNQAKMVIEEGEQGKNLYMKGIFVQGDTRNLNQRIYPLSEIKNAVESVNKQIEDGYSMLGECDHPAELTINIDRVSHVIENMWVDGNCGYGKLKILPTPHGQIIRTLIESGIKLGVSSRGSGNVDGRGYVSDFEIVTVDIVHRPSAPNAYPKPVYEAFNGKRGPILEDLAIAIAHDPKAKNHFHKEILEYINKL